MISLAQHHYSPSLAHFSSEVKSPFSDPPRSCGNQRIQTSGLEPVNTSLSYFSSPQASSPRSVNAKRHSAPALKSPTRSRHHPYDSKNNSGTESGPEGKSSAPVRRRISRACDQCNQLRTKCDGMGPCAHCIEFGLSCEYFRERKKRGKASRKDIAAQQAAAAAAASGSSTGSPNYSSEDPSSVPAPLSSVPEARKRSNSDMPKPSRPATIRGRSSSGSTALPLTRDISHEMARAHSLSMLADHTQISHPSNSNAAHPTQNAFMPVHGFDMAHDYQQQQMVINSMHASANDMNGHAVPQLPSQVDTSHAFSYQDTSLQLMSPHEPPPSGFSFAQAMDSPMNNFMGTSPNSSPPAWLALPSPSIGSFGSQGLVNPSPNLRYPVLQPLVSKLSNVIPTAVACDLLDHYFGSTTSAYLRPISPYLLGYVFRKNSFLHPTQPRKCSPSLLASMLWVAAQTSDAPFLTSPPSARGRICQKLFELTMNLLRPLVHDAAHDMSSAETMEGIALSGLSMTNDSARSAAEPGTAGTVDDVATYFHIATVVSASEQKCASMRWWTMAFTLARELKLNRELPTNNNHGADDEEDAEGDVDVAMNGHHAHGLGFTFHASVSGSAHTEEEREERRRLWWILYTVDRHLALCYNRPLFLLDAECTNLLQPVNDHTWQNGEFYMGDLSLFTDSGNSSHRPRRRGPSYECTSHSIFGFFTPLMTILGEIVELQQVRNHPRFGTVFFNPSNWDHHVAEITRHLDIYERSLNEFEARATATLRAEQSAETRHNDLGTSSGHPALSGHSASSASLRITESFIQTKTVVAYGTHVLHVLHILLTGKWDPISLLDDSDLWISSQSFIFATQHAVSGAEAVSQILEYDPELSFMPFFFGIYLLQGSFLLLLIADKLRAEASPSVVGACEVVVRAVEACVVTLSTEYQRNFRKVMRSALAQVKGRIPEDFGEQQQRRREVLALYRWTGDGVGLAL